MNAKQKSSQNVHMQQIRFACNYVAAQAERKIPMLAADYIVVWGGRCVAAHIASMAGRGGGGGSVRGTV